jgi:hypothetical protein
MDSIRAPLEWGTPGTDPVSFATIDTGIQNPWSPPLGTTDIRWNQFVNLTAHNVDDECSEMTSYQDYCYFEHLFHGTGVHSLVNSPQNGQAAVGVNPVPTGTSIALKVAYHDGFQWVVRESDFISAVQWVIDNKTLHYCVISCMDHNIRVVVTSVGYPGDDPSPHSALHNKFDESYFNNDIIAFSAAGDLRGVNTPARFGSVVAVGAVNRSLGLWLTSPSGNEIELVMPGEEIWTSWNLEDPLYAPASFQHGTSVAAPQAAGAALLFLQRNEFLAAAQVRSQMTQSARDLGGPGWDSQYGYGLVDVRCLMLQTSFCDFPAQSPPPPPPPPEVTITGPTEVPESGTCTWQAHASGGTPPYQNYTWSGALSGSGTFISGAIGQSGSLTVTVTDAAQSQDSKTIWITVDPNMWECQF